MKILNNIGIYLLYLLSYTWRIDTLGNMDKLPKVIAFWHGSMLPVWFFFRKEVNKVAVVSKSKDGQILSDYLTLLGYKLVRGSSSNSGKEVIEQAVSLAKENKILITPDGPRGPREVMKVGAVIIANRASVPLQLCSVKCKNSIRLNSWDKFQIPLPFSKVVLKFSEIVEIEDISDRKETQRELINFEIMLKDED